MVFLFKRIRKKSSASPGTATRIRNEAVETGCGDQNANPWGSTMQKQGAVDAAAMKPADEGEPLLIYFELAGCGESCGTGRSQQIRIDAASRPLVWDSVGQLLEELRRALREPCCCGRVRTWQGAGGYGTLRWPCRASRGGGELRSRTREHTNTLPRIFVIIQGLAGSLRILNKVLFAFSLRQN